MKIALKFPPNLYLKLSRDFNDFHYLTKKDRHLLPKLQEEEKEIWIEIDSTFRLSNFLKLKLRVDRFVCSDIDTIDKLNALSTHKNKIVYHWKGGQTNHAVGKVVSSVIAYDVTQRTKCSKLKKSDRAKSLYLGFRTLDELYLYPPSYLYSEEVLEASLSGIILSERERRPKALMPVDEGTELNSFQLDTLKLNIKSIKDVTSGSD